MINLKQFFDAAQAADAAVTKIATEINALFEAGDTEKALALRPKLDELKAKAKDASQMYLSMREASAGDGDPAQKFVPMGGDPEPKETKDLRASPEYLQAWVLAMRNHVSRESIRQGQHSAEKFGILLNALSETGGDPVGSEGGFGAPIEFDNKIIERMRQFKDIAALFNEEPVTSLTGWRMIETAAAALPFDTLTENEVLTDEDETESPTFQKIDYTVVDKGGFLRISNDVLMDVPARLMAYVAKWFGRKAVLTRNAGVLTLINAISPTTEVTDPDDLVDALKAILNVTLDPDIAAAAFILCNQTGFNLLDQQKDEQGRPMLQPDPSNVTLLRFAGREIVKVADRLWANPDGSTVRYAVGSAEYCTTFSRLPYEFATTNVGGSAWRSYSNEVRAVMRLVAEEVDEGAMALITSTLVAGS